MYKGEPYIDLDLLAEKSEGFSGAEIEQVVISGLYDAFEAGHELQSEDLLSGLSATIPLSRTMETQVTALQNWARAHARPASPWNYPGARGDSSARSGLRKMELS